MSDYIPSPELVELLDGYTMSLTAGESVLREAVAYRTPSGDPELIPWAEVATLIDLLREVCDAYEWTLNHPDNVVGNALHLPLIDARAALAPWTQENR